LSAVSFPDVLRRLLLVSKWLCSELGYASELHNSALSCLFLTAFVNTLVCLRPSSASFLIIVWFLRPSFRFQSHSMSNICSSFSFSNFFLSL
jgi:hypothetical protein